MNRIKKAFKNKTLEDMSKNLLIFYIGFVFMITTTLILAPNAFGPLLIGMLFGTYFGINLCGWIFKSDEYAKEQNKKERHGVGNDNG